MRCSVSIGKRGPIKSSDKIVLDAFTDRSYFFLVVDCGSSSHSLFDWWCGTRQLARTVIIHVVSRDQRPRRGCLPEATILMLVVPMDVLGTNHRECLKTGATAPPQVD